MEAETPGKRMQGGHRVEAGREVTVSSLCSASSLRLFWFYPVLLYPFLVSSQRLHPYLTPVTLRAEN